METSKYHETITKLRLERREAVDKITRATLSLDIVLNSLALDEGDTLIKWDDLARFEVGMPLHVSEKVYFVKFFEKNDSMGFKVFLKAGGSFGIQKHDCLEEAIVLKGNLVESFRGDKVYTQGQTITYVDCQLHKPYCTVDSIYKVIFTKKHGLKTKCKHDGN